MSIRNTWLSILCIFCSGCIPEDEGLMYPADPLADAEARSICVVQEEWTQPNDGALSLDLLFVMDDSESMSDNRNAMASGIPRFLEVLDSLGVNYCTGLMLAYADEPEKSGRFVAADGSELVLCRKDWTTTELTARLLENILSVSTNSVTGEAGLYSLKEAVTTHLDENQALGFFADGAALAIVFMSDENDISESRDPGGCPTGPYTFQPQGRSTVGNNCAEAEVRHRFYSSEDGFLRWGYRQVFGSVLDLKGNDPIFASSIVHLPGDDVHESEDYGYGYIEFTELAPQGQLINLNLLGASDLDSFYQEFIRFAELLGSITYRQSAFRLSQSTWRGSPRVFVDGVQLPKEAVGGDEDTVILDPRFVGGPGSQITIFYTPRQGCDNKPALIEKMDHKGFKKKLG